MKLKELEKLEEEHPILIPTHPHKSWRSDPKNFQTVTHKNRMYSSIILLQGRFAGLGKTHKRYWEPIKSALPASLNTIWCLH